MKKAGKAAVKAEKKVAEKKPRKATKPTAKNVMFTFRSEPGRSVFLSGCFNNWNPAGKKMLDKKGDGVYSTSIRLAPGTYQYKFVIDGVWCADPENLDFVPNDHGTLNSVIVVK